MKKRTIVYFIFCLLLFNFKSFSQKTEESNSKNTSSNSDLIDNYYKQSLSEKTDKLLSSSSIDGFINPDEYILGPSDIMELNIFGGVPLAYPLRVSPEGKIVIPYINEISVRDLSLSTAKNKIIDEVKKKYKTTNISVTLRNPRQFSVSVTGIVESNNFVVTPFDRVDKVVYLSTRLLKNKSEKEQLKNETSQTFDNTGDSKTPLFQKLPYIKEETLKKRDDFSLRKIKLFRKNGDTINIDMIQFYTTGDLKFNPYLRDGDVLLIPAEDIKGNFISISGAVKNPGIFEYCNNDNLSTAIRLAQGPTAIANLKEVEVYRIDKDWKNQTNFILDLTAILEDKSSDLILQRGDKIFVREKERVYDNLEVTIKGEVKKPGKYPISRGKTKLSQVVQMAGGFTEYALLPESKIIRKNLIDDEIEKYRDNSRLRDLRLGKMDKFEIEYFNLEEVIKRNYVVVDFVKLFLEKDEKSDIVLYGDETIIIPETRNSIYIYGQVANPGYIDFVPGKDYKHYVEKAGGFTDGAVKGDIKVIKSGSKNWMDPGDTIIENGDTIWIPKENIRESDYWYSIFRDIGSMVISVGTLVILILQINNQTAK